MVAFKLTFVLSATVFSVASLTYAAPTIYHAELEARDAPEHFFGRALQQRPSWATPASLQAVKSHRKDKQVLTGVPSGKRQHINYHGNHGDYQRQRVLYGANKHELDSAESHPRLNKRLPPFPSKHHCPVCHKSPKGAGYCKDHQWVCDDHSGRPWVQTKGENCQNCGSPPPKRGKKNRR